MTDIATPYRAPRSGPPPSVRIGDIVVQAGAGKVLQTGQNSNGEGELRTPLTSKTIHDAPC